MHTHTLHYLTLPRPPVGIEAPTLELLIYVYMYICIYVCIYIYMYIYIYIYYVNDDDYNDNYVHVLCI